MATTSEADKVWQDRQIRFDAKKTELKLRKGEVTIDAMESVEDTKGNNGEKGFLTVTNLRLIWVCRKNPRLNLSIGYGVVQSVNIRSANSRLLGSTQALYVMTKFNAARFEFVFTNLVKASPRLFTTVQTVYNAYDTSRIYRDLKLRGAIIRDHELLLLPGENTFNKISGVWNLSSDQGNLGTFYVTNVRVVWFANLAENFNVSVPYLQFKNVSKRDSKFGKALVIETLTRCGGFILGFRLDPPEALDRLSEEISSMVRLFSEKPIFGVEHTVEERMAPPEHLLVKATQDDVEIVDDDDMGNAMAAYYASGEHGAGGEDKEIVYDAALGLAVEKPPAGLELDAVWKMIS